MNINDPITDLKGVGKKRAHTFNNEGIETIGDLLNYYPVKFEDKCTISNLKDENSDYVTIEATVLKPGSLRFYGYHKSVLIIEIQDNEDNKGHVIFYNQPYLRGKFKAGEKYYFYGKLNIQKSSSKLHSPKYSPVSKGDEFLTITPIYRKLEGVPESFISKTLSSILDDLEIEDFLPEKYREKYGLMSLKEMYHALHNPKDLESLNRAKLRLKYNEGLKINAGIYTAHRESVRSNISLTNVNGINPFISRLPFDLTNSQENVLGEIINDLQSGFAMNRMLLGDVGSGKTIIAVICSYLMALNGYQTACMAPTEILAKQHAAEFQRLLAPLGKRAELLIGSMSPKESDEIRRKLRDGEIDVIIGTHTLIQDSTEFYNLGLVITDEQHRFGVKQRGRFGQNSGAHTLVMSATPIPRSLALTLYGDLDLSEITELPSGRQKVSTYFYRLNKFENVLEFIEKEINKGHQAFIVCPFVEDSEEMDDVVSVETAYEDVKKFVGDRYRVGYLHGKMSTDEKERIVREFNNNRIKLLVATSIIEVGIDVPNVSVIAILSADRFGLSQLHQLRGRTGRSSFKSHCFLLSDNKSEQTIDRMKTIVNCHNGHEIAIEDLKQRGAGDYFGFHQHGFGNIKFVDPIADKEIMDTTREMIAEIFKSPKAEDMICKDYLIKAFDHDTRLITMN